MKDSTTVFVISVAAEMAGMHPQTLRQYDRLGLVSPGRTGGGGRRYTEADLRAKLARAGFEVVHQRGFNKLGAAGWYVSGKLLGRGHLSPGQMKLFNRLLPLAKLVERIPGWPALSTIAVGRKP